MRLHRLLFIFAPETAHFIGLFFLKILGGLYRLGLWPKVKFPEALKTLSPFGRLPSPLGLAAGFDKNAVALFGWEALGFSFVEVGTVTPKGQSGNPRPRLFRYPKQRAIVNRMGFNNDGAYAIATRVRRAKKMGLKIKVGGNIGKNLTTPTDQAVNDFALSALALKDCVDYLVINVSSPNTPGLRALQSEENLSAIVSRVRSAAPHLPLFIKIAPDGAQDFQIGVENVVKKFNLAGVICANTVVEHSLEKGGLSGAPVKDVNLKVCQSYARNNSGLFIVGVGGIFSGADAKDYLNAGAKAVQIYSGLVYEGPSLPRQIIKALTQ